jgi:DNA mismatch repair protein MutS
VRAREVLGQLERGGRDPEPLPTPQLALFTQPAPDALREKLMQVDPDTLSPREAHTLLYALRELAKE